MAGPDGPADSAKRGRQLIGTETGSGGSATRADWRLRLVDTNISPETLLATDYLNHFNEVVMLLDLVADMPDCRDDLADWEPRSYPEHFRHSGFAHRDLAIAAWDHVEPERRRALESVVERLNAGILRIIARINADLADAAEIAAASRALHCLLDQASGIINGTARVDQVAAGLEGPADAPTLRQDDIDDLFG